MNVAEALGIVEMTEVYWPSRVLPDDTKQAWALLIVETEPHATGADGLEGLRDLAKQKYPPSISEILFAVYAGRVARQARTPSLPALPEGEFMSFAEFLNHRPQMAERIKALKDDRDHKDSPIPGGLAELLKQSGLKVKTRRRA